jgi:hypothetical protein
MDLCTHLRTTTALGDQNLFLGLWLAKTTTHSTMCVPYRIESFEGFWSLLALVTSPSAT